MSNSCYRPWWQPWWVFCRQNPNCPGCNPASMPTGDPLPSGGVTAWGGAFAPDSFFVWGGEGELTRLEGGDLAAFKDELAQFVETLPEDDLVERGLRLAAFYLEHGIRLHWVSALDEAFALTKDDPDPTIALQLAEAQRTTGLHELAVQTCLFIPQIVSSTDADDLRLLGRALQTQARSLAALGRELDADAAFALAAHVLTLAGQFD